MNVTLTAINSVLAVFTLPLVVGISMAHFLGDEASLGLQFGKFGQVFAIVLVPVLIGMAVRARFAETAERLDKPVKLASAVVLVLVIITAIVSAIDVLRDNITDLGPVALLLSVISLAVGYFVPRMFQVTRRQSTAAAMEIGIHNATLAIAVALSVLDDEAMAVPSAIYGVLMFFPAALVAVALSRQTDPSPDAGAQTATRSGR